MVEKEKIEKAEKTFSKAQILSSRKYFTRKDLLNVILEDGIEYTFSEVDKKIDNFMKKVVK
ncbi:MAG: hypothetical protein ACLT40_10585 [Fusobacterium sp.]|mgnify:CR=1 FL=1|jgi:hypothetical protein